MVKAAKPGTRVGPWTLGRVLGAGGMGTIHEASDEAGRKVALKLLAQKAPAELVARLAREADALRAIKSPHVVGFVDADLSGAVPWLAMQIIEGRALESDLHARRGRADAWPHPDAGAFAVQMARGLAAAHEQGLVHRDLKPANVMITRARRAVLVDFGLARGVDATTLTGTGDVLGSMLNVPPEHLGGGHFGPSGDVYQWGLIVHELLVGTLPFAHANRIDAVYTRAVTPPPPPAPVPEQYAHLARVVAECLAPLPAARPGDGESLVRRLESLV